MKAGEMIFKRYEIKYLLNEQQYLQLRHRTEDLLTADTYGETDICNCYYDTTDYRLIRNSMERNIYKEKLRLRSYGVPDCETEVYVELKKKYQGVVYKRRESLSMQEAEAYLNRGRIPDKDTQVIREIHWVLDYYKTLQPAMFISYQRIAMFEKSHMERYGNRDAPDRQTHTGNEDLRITFDRNILWRTEAVSLYKGIYGKPLLEPGQRIMELKTPGAIPIWLVDILDEMKLYPVSFSKYGTAYREFEKEMIK